MKFKNRRSFLKIASTVTSGALLSSLLPIIKTGNSSQPGIIILVFDALSATNMSLYGYPRQTTPNLEKFAAKCNVYHAHHSAGTFTTAGVASLLTGTYPWTHRAVILGSLIARDRSNNNIFNELGNKFNTTAFTQNSFANYILSQLDDSIDNHLPMTWQSILGLHIVDSGDHDYLAKFRSLDDFLFLPGNPGSLLFGKLFKYIKTLKKNKWTDPQIQHYSNQLYYKISDVLAKLQSLITEKNNLPNLVYFHVYPPHAPYLPSGDFASLFLNDNWQPAPKQTHPLARKGASKRVLKLERLKYDQYLVLTDSAFGDLISNLERDGLLDNNYIIVTSDHGESFERGYSGHTNPFVFEPGIKVPLLIHSPKQTERKDYHTTTNSVDIVPTLLTIAQQNIPKWSEGEILPGFDGYRINDERTTFSMDAKDSSAFGDLSKITAAMFRGKYKLIYYKYPKKGYDNGKFELYNLQNDPEELVNLEKENQAEFQDMSKLFLEHYSKASQPIDLSS